jgi:hypothetical protein
MTYWVSGWIEVVYEFSLEEKTQQWCGVINLQRFHFRSERNNLFFESKVINSICMVESSNILDMNLI